MVIRGRKVLLSRRLPTEALPNSGTIASQISGLRPNGKYRGTEEECIEYIRKILKRTYKKYEPDLVVIENYAFSPKSRSLSVLHEVGGVIKNMLHRMEAVWVKPMNNEVKLFGAGDGQASKADMLLSARRAGEEFRNSDEADAYWCARWGLKNYKTLVEIAGQQE